MKNATDTPLAGATVNLAAYGSSNYIDAANTYDGYVGLPLATTIQKYYLPVDGFGTAPPTQMTELEPYGCQFLTSVYPSRQMLPGERDRLAKWLTMMNQSGITYRVVLYSEANNIAFKTAEEWQTYWSYYAPTIQEAGVVCGYDPGCSYDDIDKAIAYFPSDPNPDELWMDYYGTAYRAGSRLDQIIGKAQAIGIPAGMAEWAWCSGPVVFNPMSMPWWNTYCSYLMSLANAGDLELGAIYFGGEANGSRVDVINSASDPRIPGIQEVANTVQTAS
jgi:hypothetical protein